MLASYTLALLFSTSAAAQETTDPVPVDLSVPYEEVLDAAREDYLGGEAEAALRLLEQLTERLAGGESPPETDRLRTYVYIGEIQQRLGRTPEARAAFRIVLETNPDYILSPYDHPIDVIGLFELVRRSVEAGQPAVEPPAPVEPTPRRPLPVWGYLPLGIPQAKQGRAGAAVLFAGAQIGSAAAGIGTYVYLSRVANQPANNHQLGWTANTIPPRVNALRYGVQWPTTLAFYGIWAASIVDADRHWQSSPRLTVVPTREGSMILLNHQF